MCCVGIKPQLGGRKEERKKGGARERRERETERPQHQTFLQCSGDWVQTGVQCMPGQVHYPGGQLELSLRPLGLFFCSVICAPCLLFELRVQAESKSAHGGAKPRAEYFSGLPSSLSCAPCYSGWQLGSPDICPTPACSNCLAIEPFL